MRTWIHPTDLEQPIHPTDLNQAEDISPLGSSPLPDPQPKRNNSTGKQKEEPAGLRDGRRRQMNMSTFKLIPRLVATLRA